MAPIDPLIQRATGTARGSARTSLQVGRRVASFVGGRAEAALRGARGPKPAMDDATLARKVETVVFRAADAPKGKVDVNAVDGVVELRGQVKRPGDIKRLETETRAIPEVRDVHNLLHLHKTPSPTRGDSPRSHTRRSEKATGGRFTPTPTSERKVPAAEDSPREKAARGEGRGPAPLGGESD